MHFMQAMSLFVEAADHFESGRITDGRTAVLFAYLQIDAAERWQADPIHDRLENEPNILSSMKVQLLDVSDAILYADFGYSREQINHLCQEVIKVLPQVLKELKAD